MSWLLRLAFGMLVAVVAVSATASAAHAHAELIRSDPELNGFVTTDIDVVRLTFTPLDATSPYVLEVVDDGGATVTTGPAVRTDAGTIEVPVSITDLGQYTVRYEVTGTDLDVTPGSFVFTVEEPSGSSGAPLILLWVGALGMAAVAFLRRPRRSAS